MKTQVIHLRQYVKAVKESHLDGSHVNSCLKAELAKVDGDVVYFRNYEDTNLDYMEFSFIRLAGGGVKFRHLSYIEDDSFT